MTTQGYTADEKSIIKSVISKYANTGVFNIEPNDPLLVSFYDIQLKLAGLVSGSAPQFTRGWQQAKQSRLSTGLLSQAASGSVRPVYSIVGIDSSDGQSWSADAIGSLPVSASNVTQTLGLFDGDATNVGAVNNKRSYVYASDCAISANGIYPASQKVKEFPVTVIYTFAQTIDNNTFYGAEIITTRNYPKGIYNEKPSTIKNPNEIKICLTRDEPDCDYRQTYAGGGIVDVPIKGQIIYNGDIDMSGSRPVNAMSSIYLIRTRAGGDPIRPYDGFDFFDKKNCTITGNTISWDLNWLKFNKVDFDSGEMVYYVFKLVMSVSGKSIVAFITNAPKNIVPGQLFLNTVQIKPMKIVYGCLGENTKIRMADGSEKAISAIRPGDSVRTRNNGVLNVEHVTSGQEQHCLNISVRDRNNTLTSTIASPGHPFITPSGIVIARELRVAGKVLTLEGEGEISNIEHRADEITVYNLQLSATETDANCMYANNILVGDIQMQRFLEDEYYQRPDNILSQLPAEWHEDFQQHLKATGE
ncbi:hypothetical protein EDF81_1109 [Enterobacter sp. BIGb0383]|uniref:Hint domain-containing protein n=1 Tax=unclassified Enterobacter TaxID=2608935 RepID=UPI000F49A8C7|nr:MULTISPECIES: Hint domain-containing protein [unclassified Enterobacter]ROP62609.1 hypothetical protein EDF81_1109 [Enterobacter sp. BIGb0383]ROS12770.1 hypothetical protein EC848_1112 [Enterobacter sp. BIGb0359]